MTFRLDRRSLVFAGGLAMGGLALPFGGLSAAGAGGFTHNVASGEPATDAMLLWTRYVPPSGEGVISLVAEIASDATFSKIVASGSVQTGSFRDWTAKILLDGLRPATTYHYRFVAPDGTMSPTGITRTLPAGNVPHFRLAVFSCANAPVGWFNAYAHAAEQRDFDLWFHVGDYIYEGARSLPPRLFPPDHEPVALADYRLRYAGYRADPDLQRLHQVAPMIALWDDHETADNSWYGGANNHQPEEGDWSIRRGAAVQAYYEWMPVSEEPWKDYGIGNLATIYRTESRLLARTQHAEPAELMKAADPVAAIKAYRDGLWSAPSATILGSTQESWLAHKLRVNAHTSTWQLVGMGTNMGTLRMTDEAQSWLPANAPAILVDAFKAAAIADTLGMASFFDNWGGYPAARSRFLRAAQAADANLVMLSGDSHNAWAFDLMEDGRPAGVEFAGHSVTSNGLELAFKADPKLISRRIMTSSPELRWADTSQRGYMMIDVVPEQVKGEWRFMQTIKSRGTALAQTHRMTVARGRRRFGG